MLDCCKDKTPFALVKSVILRNITHAMFAWSLQMAGWRCCLGSFVPDISLRETSSGWLRTGSIPSALATNTNLETLDVKGNRLSVLPSEWVNGYPAVLNSSLVNVRLSFNNFSGPFPAALSSAPQLTFLVINNNTLRWAPILYLCCIPPPSVASPLLGDIGFDTGSDYLDSKTKACMVPSIGLRQVSPSMQGVRAHACKI